MEVDPAEEEHQWGALGRIRLKAVVEVVQRGPLRLGRLRGRAAWVVRVAPRPLRLGRL